MVVYSLTLLCIQKHTTIALGDVQVCVGDGLQRLRTVTTALSLNLPADLSLESTVTVYGAVISQQQQLVKTGDFIRFSDGEEVGIPPVV